MLKVWPSCTPSLRGSHDPVFGSSDVSVTSVKQISHALGGVADLLYMDLSGVVRGGQALSMFSTVMADVQGVA